MSVIFFSAAIHLFFYVISSKYLAISRSWNWQICGIPKAFSFFSSDILLWLAYVQHFYSCFPMRSSNRLLFFCTCALTFFSNLTRRVQLNLPCCNVDPLPCLSYISPINDLPMSDAHVFSFNFLMLNQCYFWSDLNEFRSLFDGHLQTVSSRSSSDFRPDALQISYCDPIHSLIFSRLDNVSFNVHIL